MGSGWLLFRKKESFQREKKKAFLLKGTNNSFEKGKDFLKKILDYIEIKATPKKQVFVFKHVAFPSKGKGKKAFRLKLMETKFPTKTKVCVLKQGCKLLPLKRKENIFNKLFFEK